MGQAVPTAVQTWSIRLPCSPGSASCQPGDNAKSPAHASISQPLTQPCLPMLNPREPRMLLAPLKAHHQQHRGLQHSRTEEYVLILQGLSKKEKIGDNAHKRRARLCMREELSCVPGHLEIRDTPELPMQKHPARTVCH